MICPFSKGHTREVSRNENTTLPSGFSIPPSDESKNYQLGGSAEMRL